jgi:hypothetical protein
VEPKNYIYSQLRNNVVREYEKKVQGNRVTEENRAGKNLKRAKDEESLLKLKDVDERLEINDPSEELEDIEMDRLEEVLRSYKQDLEQAEKILEDSDRGDIAYEVAQIKLRVNSILEKIKYEM